MLSLVFQFQSECVIPFFDSAESQESDSDIDSRDGTQHCALGPILRPEILTLVSVVQSLSVLPFFTSAGPQEFNSDIGSRNRTRQRALRPILRPNFFSTETHMVTSTDPLEVKYQVSNHK